MRSLKITITWLNPVHDKDILRYIEEAMKIDEKSGAGTTVEARLGK